MLLITWALQILRANFNCLELSDIKKWHEMEIQIRFTTKTFSTLKVKENPTQAVPLNQIEYISRPTPKEIVNWEPKKPNWGCPSMTGYRRVLDRRVTYGQFIKWINCKWTDYLLIPCNFILMDNWWFHKYVFGSKDAFPWVQSDADVSYCKILHTQHCNGWGRI